jgi:uncharacterized protein with PIN domain
MDETPRFIADAMLGSLARWLRIVGVDTLYFRVIEDAELVRIAKQEGRILLSKDTALCRSKRTGKRLLIRSDKTLEQLKEVVKAFNISYGTMAIPKRCTLCNGVLVPAGRNRVYAEVPDYVFQQNDAFLKCGECGKVYWEGSHRAAMVEILTAVIKDTENTGDIA